MSMLTPRRALAAHLETIEKRIGRLEEQIAALEPAHHNNTGTPADSIQGQVDAIARDVKLLKSVLSAVSGQLPPGAEQILRRLR